MGGRGTSYNNPDGIKGRQKENYKTGSSKWVDNAVKDAKETKRLPFKTDGTMKLNKEKIKVYDTTDPIAEGILKINLGKVKELQKVMDINYGIKTKKILDNEKTELKFFGGKSDGNSIAVYFDNNIVFNIKKYNNIENIKALINRQMASQHFAKVDNRNTTSYTVTHEFGHFVQDAIIKNRLEKKGLQYNLVTEREEAQVIRKEILKINKEKYGNNDASVSRYGLTNSMEFFAEAFTESQLSSNKTTIAKAMNDFLKQEGKQFN